jgi:hypothetical protein
MKTTRLRGPVASARTGRGLRFGSANLTLRFTLTLDPTVLRDGSTPAWIESAWLDGYPLGQYLVEGGMPTIPQYQAEMLGRALSAPDRLSVSWRVRARKYRRGQGIASRKKLFLCPTSCEAGRLATWLHHLPWSRFITLTAPSSDFRSALRAWRGLDILNALGDPSCPQFVQPFWSSVISSHEDPRKFDLRTAPLHLHVLIGGIDKRLLDSILVTWPYVVPREGNKPIDSRVWSVLHYLYGQIKGGRVEKLRHNRQDFYLDPRKPLTPKNLDFTLMTGYSPLVVPPLYSTNIGAIQAYFADTIRTGRRQSRSSAGRLGGLARLDATTRKQRAEWGRMGARKRWSRSA